MKDFFAKLFGKNASATLAEEIAVAPESISWEPYKSGDVIAEKYEVHRVLGKGGFGIVYLVRLRDTGEAYALKTFKNELTADPAALVAFKREALVWVNLERHPFILPAVWVEEIRYGRIATREDDGGLNLGARHDQSACGRLLVVMDYVAADANGRASLGDHLGSRPIDETQVLKWGIQFCLGMEHARAHGVECHRDIKPANILITQDGTLKVSDFGLALATEAAWRGTNVQTHSLNTGRDGPLGLSIARAGGKARSGTPGYIAPEVFRYDGATVRSDIYSFGLVLWQMTTGSRIPPFRVTWRGDVDEYMSEIYEHQMTGRIPRLEGALGTVIERCLRAEPSQRYGTFAELRGAFDTIFERKTGQKFQIPDLGEKTVAFWNNKGGALAALGRQEEAIRCYDKALEIDPRAPQAWNNKGSALSALDRNEDALRCYDKAFAIDPRFAMALAGKGRVLHVLGQLDEALRCFDQALSLDSRIAARWQGRGEVLATMDRHADAVACFDKALAIAPQSLESLYNKGLSLLGLGKDAEASECFDQVILLDGGFEMAWINKGNILAAKARYEEAVACFDMAIAINPRNADTFNNKATSLAAMGTCDEAVACWDKALAIDSRNANAWSGKGAALAAARKPVDAARCYETALTLDAGNVVAWCGKGSALGAAGRHAEAVSCFEQALTIEPRNAAALLGKAISEEIEKRWAEAANSYRMFIEFAGPLYADEIAAARKQLNELARHEVPQNRPSSEEPSTPETWINRGSALNEGGQFAEAVICYDRALALDSNNVSVWYWKGCVFAKMGKHADAVASYRNAVRLDPTCVVAWFNMAHCLGLLGQHEDVLRCCDRALEINPREAPTWILKGVGLCALERYQEAIRCLQEAEKLGDTNAAAHIAHSRRALTRDAERYFRLGSQYQEEGNNAEAIACYAKGLAIEPHNAAVWINKGAALLALNRATEAVACFDRAISLDPNDSSAWNNKGIALMSLGQREEGATCLLKAIRMREKKAEQ